MRGSIILIALPIVFSSIGLIHSQHFKTSFRRSSLDGKWYNVRSDVDSPEESVELLAELRRRLDVFSRFLDPSNPYHKRFLDRFRHTILKENPLKRPSPNMTSYSINKGQEIIMCLRNPETGKLHDIDVLTYVILHEASHIACPEVGHTPLFVQIFSSFLKIALFKARIIQRTDYRSAPVRYCGMTLSEKLV